MAAPQRYIAYPVFAFLVAALMPLYAAAPLISQEVFFLGIDANQSRYAAGANISVNMVIVNERQYTPANLSIHYQIIRTNDSASIFSTYESVDLKAKETRAIKRIAPIPQMIIPGKYEATAELIDESGTAVSSVFHLFVIDANVSQDGGALFREGEFYLTAPIARNDSISTSKAATINLYGLNEETIPSGREISAHFSLNNPRNVSLNLSARLEIMPAYGEPNSSIVPQATDSSFGTLEPGENKSSSIKFTISQPEHYSIVLSIYSRGAFLCSKSMDVIAVETAALEIPANLSMCTNDGVCMETELTAGNCTDCQSIRTDEGNYAFYKNLSFALLAIILLLLISIWQQKK